VLFCAALAIFFLSIFTPLWLALNTTAGKIVIGGLLALVFVAVSAPGEICEIICKTLFAQQSKVHVFLKIWKICLA